MLVVRRLIWNPWNIGHIARHEVTPEDVEQVCHGNPVVQVGKQGRSLVFGPRRWGSARQPWPGCGSLSMCKSSRGENEPPGPRKGARAGCGPSAQPIVGPLAKTRSHPLQSIPERASTRGL